MSQDEQSRPQDSQIEAIRSAVDGCDEAWVTALYEAMPSNNYRCIKWAVFFSRENANEYALTMLPIYWQKINGACFTQPHLIANAVVESYSRQTVNYEEILSICSVFQKWPGLEAIAKKCQVLGIQVSPENLDELFSEWAEKTNEEDWFYTMPMAKIFHLGNEQKVIYYEFAFDSEKGFTFELTST